MTIEQQQPVTNNKNNRIWIGLGIAALFCICAIGVAGLTMYGIGKRVQSGMSTDPESAAQAAKEIVDGYELPEGYQEQGAMDLSIYSLVMIAPEGLGTAGTDGPLIMLVQFSSFGTNEEQMKEQLRQSLEQQAGNNGTNLELVEVKTMTIRGEESEVAIYEGADQAGNTMRQLITAFAGNNGTAMLMITGDAEDWDQDALDAFIESIE